ncbi:hypothetical protein, conserved [Leishmania tarentolae]|uniref:Uncharacterized protein n=1 Tax=Leishmania tarentolae TaxID=5689 RepID=A0A640KKP9_LEITA|nr:hypothetical protein, conserved [Leishmania tarentolae]
MDSHMDPVGGVGSVIPGHQPSPGTRRFVRRTPASGGSASATDSNAVSLSFHEAASASTAAATATQTVKSEAEGDALIKRIRQLESEGAMLSQTLSKVCQENGQLSAQITALGEKLQALAQEPLKGTSVLHSLFEPEKTGWFAGSKSEAREQLEQLSDALQTEFMAYKASHASSNDEVQALMEGLHSAHLNAQELSKVVRDQQQLISSGPLAVAVHIVPFEGSKNYTPLVHELQEQLEKARERAALTEDELSRAQAELRAMKAENTKLRNDTIANSALVAPESGVPVAEAHSALFVSEKPSTDALECMTRERDALQDALLEARNTLAERDKDAELQKHMVAQLENKLAAKDTVHTEEVDKLRQQLANSFSASMTCGQCDELRQELEKARRDVDVSHMTVQDLRSQIVDMTVQHEERYNALEKRMADALNQLNEKDEQLHHLTSADDYENLKLEQESLTHEIDLYRQRIAFLETNRKTFDDAASETALDETKVLETLSASKERISKLEFERDQLAVQLQQAQTYAVSRDAEARQLQQRSEDDKKRVAFLMKKCASATADLRSAMTQLDTFKEQFEKQSLELKQERRNVEGMPKLQQQFDELSKEKRLLEDRLAATQAVEERLVKAKETIAYMELAQSSTICMSQFAELKAEKEKLQNSMEPLDRKLSEARQEIERLKSVTDAQQAISETQNKNVLAWQEQVTALSESEAKLRDKAAMLASENARLTQVNASLEQQMNDMQDGIREMAMHMEKDRANSKAAAEASSQKEIQTLRDELAQARETIAEVQARDGQYVADGLYQSVVAERDRSLEENKRMTVELEKHKSEISIYRQTITDLEQENDERVKEIESLQERYQSDRAALNDRLAKEQKRTAELSSSLAGLTEHVSAMEAEAAKHATLITELQEKNAKQQRVFEDKCRREEALGDEIKRLNGQISILQASATPQNSGSTNNAANTMAAATVMAAASATGVGALAMQHNTCAMVEPASEVKAVDGVVLLPNLNHATQTASQPLPSRAAEGAAAHAASAPEPIAIDAFCRRIEDLQRDNDRLKSELQRTEAQYQNELANDQRMITILQTDIKNRMSTNNRVAYEAEILRSQALKKSMEALMEENTQLRKQARVGQVSENMPASASLVAMAGTQREDMLQPQSELQAQKSTRDSEMGVAERTMETYKARIQELEEQLNEAKEAAAAAARGTDTGGDAADNGNVSACDKPAKRRMKKIKKKTLAEQIGATDDGEDILAVYPQADAAPTAEKLVEAGHLETPRSLAHQEVYLLMLENEKLTAENTQLKATVEDLSAKLRNTSSSHNDGANIGKDNQSCGNNSIADLEMQLQQCQNEVERLVAENRSLQCGLKREEAQRSSSVSTTTGAAVAQEKRETSDVRKLQRQLKQKDAEIKTLAAQLMPTKEKLVEYMAMADRLGLQYPFPPELEGATVLRLRALHLPVQARATSAPAPVHQKVRSNHLGGKVDGASPPPRTPRARHTGGGGGVGRHEGEDFSLR